MRLLVTRPEPDGERTATALRRLGHAVTLVPLFRIETVPNAPLGRGPFTGVVMTSGNAARAIAAHPRHPELLSLPLFAVGARTADAAHAAGFSSVTSADGDVAALKQLLAGKPGPLLYLAGEDRADNFADIPLTIAIVYRAAAAEAFPAFIRAQLERGDIDGVLHFSRRAAMTYLHCARAAGLLDKALAPAHFCLSRQVAEPLEAAGARGVLVASRPDETALIARIDER